MCKLFNLASVTALFLLLAVGILPGRPAQAQPLTTAFTYQGELQISGLPAAGPHDLRFRLFDAAAGGAQVGATLCTDNVALAEARFTVSLDFGAAFIGQQRFLEIEARADTGLDCLNAAGFVMLSPRQPLTAAPNAAFALTAASATTATQLNGQAAAFYQNAANLSAGTLTDLRLSTNVALLNNAQTFSAAKTFGVAPFFTAAGSPFSVSSTTLVANLNADLLDGQGAAFYQNAGNINAGELADARLGGMYSGVLTFGNVGNAFTGSGAGLTGLDASNIATGTLGDARLSANVPLLDAPNVFTGGPNTFGGSVAMDGFQLGSSANAGDVLTADASGVGMWQPPTGGGLTLPFAGSTDFDGPAMSITNSSTSGNGVYALASASNGFTRGGFFESTSTDGRGVFGYTSATTGSTYGVVGQSDSTNGRGVFGYASNTNGSTYGVFGQTNSPYGSGVFGLATDTGRYGGRFESESYYGRGVYGYSRSTDGYTYGVVGRSDSPLGYAVYAFGDIGASGVKPFRIDHPADPENKYLLHYCAEGPEPQNVYNATAVLDSAGEAIVELPSYFAQINRDPRYMLTAIGAPMPMLHVAEEISEEALKVGEQAGPGVAPPICWFRIAGGAPGAKVSWEVKALRNDLWVRTRGAPVEVDKEGLEKGTYQHPELYGQRKERGMNYDAKREESLARASESTGPRVVAPAAPKMEDHR